MFLPTAHHLNEPVALPILGHQPHADGDAITDRQVGDVLVAEQYAAARDRVATGQGLHQLSPASTHKAVKTDDLALMHVQRDIVDNDPAGVRLGDGDTPDRQRNVAEVAGSSRKS